MRLDYLLLMVMMTRCGFFDTNNAERRQCGYSFEAESSEALPNRQVSYPWGLRRRGQSVQASSILPCRRSHVLSSLPVGA